MKLPEEDPLWFLTRRDEPAAAEAAASPVAATQNADAGAPVPVAEPILTRPEVLRATMPPFFGSTAEVAKPEPALLEARGAGSGASQPSRPAEVAPAVAAGGHGAARQAPPVNAGADAATAASQPLGASPLRNGLAGRTGEMPGEVRAQPAGDMPHTRALEAAVLELLKPMLSEWLERNMPRLVAEALKDEAARARTAEGGGKKA